MDSEVSQPQLELVFAFEVRLVEFSVVEDSELVVVAVSEVTVFELVEEREDLEEFWRSIRFVDSMYLRSLHLGAVGAGGMFFSRAPCLFFMMVVSRIFQPLSLLKNFWNCFRFREEEFELLDNE